MVASGARYRRPDIPNLSDFEGAGVSYWASPVEAKLCEGEEVALVGGGNSAGQAVVFLAPKVKRLHLVVRGKGLEATMSRYLIDRIQALPNVELHVGAEVVALDGDRDRRALQPRLSATCDIGKHPAPIRCATSFPVHRRRSQRRLAGQARRRGRQGLRYHRPAICAERQPPAARRCRWRPAWPGVFAIGDVRAGSTKRVAAAVGEGAAVVAQIHQVLAGRSPSL